MNVDAPLVSTLFGIFLLLFYGWMWRMPAQADTALRAYPRSVWPARILVAISFAWFAYNLNQVDLGRFNSLKVGLWVLVPVGVYLMTKFIPDLLAIRASCTFCLLAGQPVLVAVRWHGSPAQYVVALFVYILMVTCMFLVVYPHFWYRGLDWLKENPKRRPLPLSIGCALGGILLISGIVSF